MHSETKNCQNCKKDFLLEAEDFAFFEKLKVPPPTWCPDCRQMRRMSYRNERTLYKRKCDKTGKDIFSVFSPQSPYKVYDYKEWYDGGFDPSEYSRPYDFSRSFFEQYHEFMLTVPWPSLRNEYSENSPYNNDVGRVKNCYLCSRVHRSVNMMYVYHGVESSKDCVDCMQVSDFSEFLYECVECIGCRNASFLWLCSGCTDSSYLYNCKNSLDCFMSSNLRNKQYVFRNEQLSKEEYQKRMATVRIESFSEREALLDEFYTLCHATIRKNLYIVNSQNVRGDNIVNSNNAYMCFGIKSCENVRHMRDIRGCRDSMDCYSGGDSELLYECTTTGASFDAQFSYRGAHSRDIEYCFFVKNCKNMFACIGLENKEFCIFNTQYTQEEYEKLLPKIKKHMEEVAYTNPEGITYRYGEFFPMEFSLFAYNETIAQQFFPLTKEQALAKGLRWQDFDPKNHMSTLDSENVPDTITEVSDDILKETIRCNHGLSCEHQCTGAFRIIPAELEFYRRMKLPLPRLCPNCRHYRRFELLNPQKLWPRSCMCELVGHEHEGRCQNEFETSYAPERPEVVYCEGCYQKEVI